MVLDQVRVSTRHTLNCANDATVATLESPFSLGPMDHTVPAMLTIEAIFVYRKPATLPDDNFFPVERLKVAVSHLLDYYPHLTGRLQQNQVSQAPEIGSLGTGAELWEADCPRRLRNIAVSALSARILVIRLPGDGNALLPIFHTTVGAMAYNPIFAIQHTRFGCGGVALGIRVHHLVCDATGYMQLVRDLADIYKQLRDSSPPTLISPPEIISQFRGTNNPSSSQKERAIAFNPPNFYLDTNTTDKPKSPAPSTVIACPLRFQGEDLALLKNAARDPNAQRQTSFTTFELISAYLYQRIYQARMKILRDMGLTPDIDSLQSLRGFWTTMDMRDSTRLKLPARYFPNAIHCISTSASHDLLENGALWQVAQVIHDAIHSVDMDEIKQQFEWVAAQLNKSHVKSKNVVPSGSFVATQWARGKTYVGVDFEVALNGRRVAPDLVSPAFTESHRADGYAVILSTEEQLPQRRRINGRPLAGPSLPCAVDVNLALDMPVWDVLNNDSDFLALLS
ncbi:Transferase [Penicillium cf. griseofulvum]|uniref:Transferase n=1 Tax=Penicillium cf. griseofulvum TaxID=2972120 RepID=A0A9W9T126_9EURO|nr:Transferase [Penicillium cf. griseofulvum]KAJ5437531.1 Transferase [Penicillium cf. griseofulvum]KAJ5441675.1 Transferase [Penicillium cf. griseofulvum]